MATKTAATKRAPKKRAAKKKWTSRAVTRYVEPGSAVYCAHCDERVKFQAKIRQQQVICNVYVKGRWDRVEHFHHDCYDTAGNPYGAPQD